MTIWNYEGVASLPIIMLYVVVEPDPAAKTYNAFSDGGAENARLENAGMFFYGKLCLVLSCSLVSCSMVCRCVAIVPLRP